MKEREPGFYRIERNGEWRIAEWAPIGYWYITGVGYGIKEEDRFITRVDETRISELPDSERMINIWNEASENARRILKYGDRIRCTRCGGVRAYYTFAGWCGNRIISKSGIDDLSAVNIDMLNGQPVSFVEKQS